MVAPVGNTVVSDAAAEGRQKKLAAASKAAQVVARKGIKLTITSSVFAVRTPFWKEASRGLENRRSWLLGNSSRLLSLNYEIMNNFSQQ
jgi:hypothetical protein